MEDAKVLLSQEELDKLKGLQNELNSLLLELGSIEAQKHEIHEFRLTVLKKLEDLKKQQNELGTALNTKYGAGTIDLASGEFIANK
jgi:predicted nuclease with TOPRIM domain